ncbi:MAG: hypothetical protein N2053_01795 [Chitinispirillaceae bacterium]|nr:hypothetical protein [Chitinispirillaceae bacterium]
MKIKISIFICLIVVMCVFSQYQYETGIGARAFSMGNNHVALTSGVVDLYWNPAALSFSMSRELQFSLYGIRIKSNSDFFGTSRGDYLQRFKLENAGFLFAVPTTKGGLSFALSFSNPIILDDVFSFSGNYYLNDSIVSVNRTFRNSGSLHYWSGGFGLQVAENLGAGISLSLVTGSSVTDGNISKSAIYNSENFIEIDDYGKEGSFLGYDIRGGLFYQLKSISLGLRVVAPQIIKYRDYVEGEYYYTGEEDTINYSYQDWTDYNMYSSYKGAIGASFIFPYFTLATEIRGTLPYDFIFPVERIPENTQASRYKYGGGIGFEAPLVVIPVILRTGYSYDKFDLHPFVYKERSSSNVNKIDWSDGGVKVSRNLHRICAGLGYVTSSTSFELSYSLATWGLITRGNLNQIYILHRVSSSFAIRF